MIFQFDRWFVCLFGELFGSKVYYCVFLIRIAICIHYSTFENYEHLKVCPCVLLTFSLT